MLQDAFTRFLGVLENSERAPRSDLLRYQQRLVAQLVCHAYEHVSFYRDRLACLFGADGRLDLSRWGEVPLVTRAEALIAGNAMRTPELPAIYGPITEIKTSGSTGQPLRIASNALNFLAANAALVRLARWWGIDASRPLAKIVINEADEIPAYPEGRERDTWSYGDRRAPIFELDLSTPIEQQIEWLRRKKAPYLMTLPSNAVALSYAVAPEQARELGIEVIFAIGETVLPQARKFIAERFGARLVAIYSCQEVGLIATQCPTSTDYHMVVENCVVEILRDNGTPALPGEYGQVVVTGFYNYAMPFIRYSIGDVATVGRNFCSCDRSLPLIAQIDGRTRHAFVFRDGTRVWPRPLNFSVSEFVACREYQLAQLDRERIEFRYVPDGSGRAPDHAGLDAYIKQKIHPSAEVLLAPMQSIPRGPGGKLTPFISMVID